MDSNGRNSTMHDRKANEPQSQPKRAPWVQPTVRQLTAGSAELLVAVVNDGPGDES